MNRNGVLGLSGAENRAVLDASLDAIFILGDGGRILHANQVAADCYGYTIEELKELNAVELAAPELGDVPLAQLDGMLIEPKKFESRHQRCDGTFIDVEISSQPITCDHRMVIFVSVRDISARKSAQSQLQESEHFLRRIVDAEPGTVYIYDLSEQRNVFSNRRLFSAFGYSAHQAETMAGDMSKLFHPDDLPMLTAHYLAWSDGVDDELRELELRARDAQGHWRWMISREIPFSRDSEGCITQVLGIAHDISVRKHEKVWLERQTELLEMIVAGVELPLILTALVDAIESLSPGMLGSILLLDPDGVHLRHGAAPSIPTEFTTAIDGIEIGPRVGSCGTAAFRHEAVYVEDVSTDPLWKDYAALAKQAGLVSAWSQPILDGNKRVLGTFALYYGQPALPNAAHLQLMSSAVHVGSIAITRHREVVALVEKDARLLKAQELGQLGFIELNLKSDTFFCSDEAFRMCGLARDKEFLSADMVWKSVHPDDLVKTQSLLQAMIRGEGVYNIDHRLLHTDGRVVWVHAQAELIRGENGDSDLAVATIIDITKSKVAEIALERMTRLYAALSHCNQAIVRCESEHELFPKICRDAVEHGGMRMVWIGKIDQTDRALRCVSSFGEGAEHIRSLAIPVDVDCADSAGPTGVAVREDRPYWCQDFNLDPRTAPWRDLATGAGLRASASLPLHQGGVVVGALGVYSGVRDSFDQHAQDLLIEMAADISFALDNFAREAERKRSEEKLFLSEQRLRTMIETEPECVKLVGRGGELLEMNTAGLTILEADSLEEARSNSLLSYLVPEHRQPFIDLHERVMGGETGSLEFEIVGRNGTRRWLETHAAPMRDAAGNIESLLGISRDVTDRKHSEERIQYLANFDALTGLANRNLLNDHLQYAISLAKRNDGHLAVMFIDLDRFKEINDTLGHGVGDTFLIEVGARLKAVLRETDTTARLGGDEFILVLPETDAQAAADIAEKVLQAIAVPYEVEHYALIVAASIGIAIYPNDGDSRNSLLRSADAAMYRVKDGGRNGYRFFTSDMQADATRRLQLLNAMHRALELDEFHLHYQPQFSLDGREMIGVEALLRWNHPALGAISPMEFIPVAEDSGLILPIGEWVLRTAVKQLKRWMDLGHPAMIMAVNLSVVQFRHSSLPELISSILADAELPANLLELELTEGLAMRDPLGAIAVMNDLHERGIRMSIDDFGTGYSSLSYLKKFRVYKLKIDKSFIQDISTDDEDRAIVAAIISMSASLGMKSIAEGVETIEQLQFLRELGCDEAQGYYFSKPLPVAEMDAMLAARRAHASVKAS